MADARALLRAKRQEAKITHPYAAYNQAGQLRCTICSTIVKHASAWEGHLGSKAHRLNVARLREEEKEEEERRLREAEQSRRQAEELRAGKRKVEEQDEGNVGEVDSKKRKTANTGFPADFFSDPNHGPVAPSYSDSEDEDMTAPAQVAQAPQAKSAIDLEFEQFQRELLSTTAAQEDGDRRDTYERATVAAEPELRVNTDGVPIDVPKEELVEENEEEVRARKEREERELIMDRLLEEERAQEEADMKVTLLKNRIEAAKQKRAARLAAQASKS